MQREALLTNPNLTPKVLAWIVANTTFNPAYVATFANHSGMTEELRAAIRTW